MGQSSTVPAPLHKVLTYVVPVLSYKPCHLCEVIVKTGGGNVLTTQVPCLIIFHYTYSTGNKALLALVHAALLPLI